MNQLFNELLAEIRNFLKIGKTAYSKLSDLGEADKKQGYLEQDQKYWQLILDTAEDRYVKLKDFLQTPNPLSNKVILNQRLAYFREMPRRISENAPEWSAYYNDINENLKSIHRTLIDIDTTYKLGQHASD